MKRRQFISAIPAAVAPAGVWAAASSETDAAAGVRAALERGAAAAVSRLGRVDGFLGDPKVRIPLPGALQDAAPLLRAAGQQQRIDELVTAMNRAAESAVAEAKPLLVDAVRRMSVEDALRIVRGSDTAVTEFFVGKTRTPLTERFLPIVTKATSRLSLASKYNALAGRATSLGLLKPESANLEQHVTARALDGLYQGIADEERRIRQDPVGTGSAILRKVFGR